MQCSRALLLWFHLFCWLIMSVDAFQLNRRGYGYIHPHENRINLLPPSPTKRESAFVLFSRFMTRQDHEGQPGEGDALMEKLFKLFDMNENDNIEREEFRAMLTLLGFIRQTES